MDKPLKILMVEDSEEDAELIKNEIRKNGIKFTVYNVETKEDYIRALHEFNPDIILSDYSLPNFNGMKALIIRKELVPSIPFILVTGSINEETAVEVMKAGADDYIIKEHITRIGTAIIAAIEKCDIIRLKKEAEEKLRILSLTVEQNPASIIITDIQGIIEYVNPKFTRISGYNREEVIGKNPRLLKSGTTSPEEYKLLWDTINSGGTWQGEFQNLKKNGEIFYESATISPITDEFGNITNFLAVNEDITERKYMKETIAWEQYLIQTLLENIPDNIYFKDLESRFIRINKAMAQLFGLDDPLEALGKTDSDFFKAEHSQQALQDEQKIIETGIPIIGKEEMETWFDRPPSWVSTTKMPLRDAKGKIVGTFGISRDITGRKRVEDELVKAKEKAEESDRLKTSFLQNISHEIRTPLNAIVGFSEFLKDPALIPDKRRHFTDIIIKSSYQLLSIISDIISIATLEAGQEKINTKELNINVLCRLIYEQFNSLAQGQNNTLLYKTTIADNEALIISDETKLTQILSNLVGNALKFTKQGNIEFGYKIKDNFLEFYTRDTGIGIASDMHEEIFKRFRQVEINANQHFGGSGLGLSISKAYVELLGGKIWLTSEPGKGSVFYFTIPLISVNPNPIEDTPAVNGSGTAFKKPKTFLIAEDEDSNFLLLVEMISEMKINIVRAVNGIEAVEICRSGPIDLVLMDIKMPEMDGCEATKLIRNFLPGIPIIAQTAYALSEERERAFQAGCDDYVTKPIRKEDIIALIRNYLEKGVT
jgi:PAS domain S-box-containing protein